MSNDFDFIEIQPSTGILKDDEGKTIALVWIFRPDVTVEERHWFETKDIGDHEFLCIETGPDKIPVNCKKVYKNLDGPSEFKRISNEEILKCFEFCCNLIARNYKEHKMKQLGDEILKDTFFGDIKYNV